MRKVELVHFQNSALPKPKNVAAYARVSCGKDEMLHSLAAQVEYYKSLITSHNGWQYAGVYADEARTGTKENREQFQKLITDCRSGKIDMVITKSVSRLARNTVTLLETIRELKLLGIDVYFEEQNIHTESSEGELLITLLASYAQEESRSVSENQKWRVKKNFQEGIPWNQVIYGYRFEKDKFVIVPEEATIIKKIFDCYLSGMGIISIEKKLNSEGFRSRGDAKWSKTSIRVILNNYHYTGNLLLQKTFRKDHISKKTLSNTGELPKYFVENSHEAIISTETFEKAQLEFARRSSAINRQRCKPVRLPFSDKVFCGKCGKYCRRKTTATGKVWICSTYDKYGKAECPSKQIPENTLISLIESITDDYGRINRIEILPDNTVNFTLNDEQIISRTWQDRSRRESWTPEMREAARKKALERRQAQCQEQ